MDEILIDEKRYVSSKRAAKMTGYAKDYIGQLCREGRVPARLVGRSWYVLETAIQDHRFGTTDAQNKETVQTTPVVPVFSQKWESPKYEASSEELLPSIKRPQQEAREQVLETAEEFTAPEPLQDSWREWFDRVADMEVAIPITKMGETKEDVAEEEKVETTEVNIPIHAMYQQPPRELLPRDAVEMQDEEREEPQVRQEKRPVGRATIRTIQVTGVLVAGIMASIAVIGSGYLDEYIISNSQVRIFAGVVLYNK